MIILLACRNPKKATKAVDKIKKASKAQIDLEMMELDLASLASVRQFVANFLEKNLPLHLLINNAGIMNTTYGKTVDGFEQQFGVNHLGHFLLTYLLIPTLKESAPARVVNVSSTAHKMMPYAIETIYHDINMEKNYTGWESYSRSKLANIIFSNGLDRRLNSSGVNSFSLHPGVIHTSLWQHSIGESIFIFLSRPFLKSVPQGAATTVFCATHPSLDGAGGGKYYEDCKESTPIGKATNLKLQDDLWDISLKLLGLEENQEAEQTEKKKKKKKKGKEKKSSRETATVQADDALDEHSSAVAAPSDDTE